LICQYLFENFLKNFSIQTKGLTSLAQGFFSVWLSLLTLLFYHKSSKKSIEKVKKVSVKLHKDFIIAGAGFVQNQQKPRSLKL